MKNRWARHLGAAALIAALLLSGATTASLADGGQVRLQAMDAQNYDGFGSAVAIDGDTAVVGAPYASINSITQQGAAYVFVRSGSNWGLVAKLTAADGGAGDNFGTSVAISGTTIVIGAPYALGGDQDTYLGAAYVFTRPASGWQTTSQPQAKLFDAADTSDGEFGTSVAIDGDTIAIGAPYREDPARPALIEPGVVYVFTKPAAGWSGSPPIKALLTADNASYEAHLGQSVAISGEIIAAGAPAANTHLHSKAGAIYVYTRPSTGWASGRETSRLVAVAGDSGDELGNQVSISGWTIVATALHEWYNGGQSEGAVYVYRRPLPDGWQQNYEYGESARLTASDSTMTGCFASSVAIDQATIVVGDSCHDSTGVDPSGNPVNITGTGNLYRYQMPPGGWADETETEMIFAFDRIEADSLGWAVDVSGNAILGGAPFVNVGSNLDAGAAYIIPNPLPVYTHFAYLPFARR